MVSFRAALSNGVGFKLLAAVLLLCLIVGIFVEKTDAIGFAGGALAFSFSALGLERLTARVLSVGDLRVGVRSAIFWLIFKFAMPGVTIFYAVSAGCSLVALVLGMISALAIFAKLLWMMIRSDGARSLS